MPVEKTLHIMNKELQWDIIKEINSVSNNTRRDAAQLNCILEELIKMDNGAGVIISYPRIIIESWDYTDPLGLKLMKYAELYRKSNV